MVPGGNEGDVLVEFGEPGTSIRGRRFLITVTGVSPNADIDDMPEIVRKDIVGLSFDAVLTREQILAQSGQSYEAILPEGSVVAYVGEIIAALQSAGKVNAAVALKAIAQDEHVLYVLEREIFRVNSTGTIAIGEKIIVQTGDCPEGEDGGPVRI